MKICRHCLVSGKVQGVFFRQTTFEQATSLGVTGWVRNLENGDVECFLAGEEAQVKKLCEWLHQGPPAAQVTAVKIEAATWEDHEKFIIIR